MRWLITIWRNLFHKRVVDQTLDEELRSYRQLLEDEKIAAGADSQTAQREAALEIGGIEVIKEQVRDIRRGAFLEGFWTELPPVDPRTVPQSGNDRHVRPHAGSRHWSQHDHIQRF